jgi:hypothetical protein
MLRQIIITIIISVLAVDCSKAGDSVSSSNSGKSPDGTLKVVNVKFYVPPGEAVNPVPIIHFEIHDSKGKVIASQFDFEDLYAKTDDGNFCYSGAGEISWRADSRYVVFPVQVEKHSDQAVLLENIHGKIRRIELPDLGFVDCYPREWDDKGYLHLFYQNGYKAYDGDSQDVVVRIPDGSTKAVIVQKLEIQHDPDRDR